MAPGMFDRERRAHDELRRDWLIEMAQPLPPRDPGSAHPARPCLAAVRAALSALRRRPAGAARPTLGHEGRP